MDPSRSDRILQDWDEVASQARRPVAPPRRVVVTGGLSGTSLAGALVIVAALLIAVAWFGRPSSDDQTGVVPPQPSATPAVTPLPSETPPTQSTPGPTSTPAGSPESNPCLTTLDARITLWEGAAGHRIAHVRMTNTGSLECIMPSLARPQLVDGGGSVLIDGTEPTTTEIFTLAPGAVATTLVQAGNYCGPAPTTPVSVAFVMSAGRIVAAPVSPNDSTLPPCLGSPGSAGTIEMQPWAQ
jgi:hypothetical protein